MAPFPGAMSKPEYEPLWSTAQAAEFLGLKPKTVLNMCSLGEIPHMKNGRLNAYYRSELAPIREARLSNAKKMPGVGAPGENSR